MNQMIKPYTEEIVEQHGTGVEYIYRTFSSEVNADALVWHRDRKSRQIKVLSGKGWKFQEDDKLPVDLQPGSDVYIIRGIYHRLIKGVSDLIIRIKEI